MDFRRRRSTLIAALTLAGVLAAVPAYAQVATAPELKAAFLLNFMKFTTWPASVTADGADLRMCVVGDGRVVIALDEVTRGHRIDGRGIVVVALGDQDDVRRCHLLYASGLRSDREKGLIDATRGRPILTASDSSAFMKHGGVAAFHIAGGRMRFSVNPSAAERSQLRISSKLLSLAVIVKDGSDVQNR
jgi:hypothetical protein